MADLALDQTGAPQPLYRRIKDHILGHIRSGEWPAGHKIPSENMFVDEFGISRMTVNRALRELTRDGYLSRIPGVGTFVREVARQASLIDIMNIADEIRDRGGVHACNVISLRTVSARAELAARFEDVDGMDLFHIVAVHTENGVPVQLEERYVNPAVAPDFLTRDFAETTPTEYLLGTAAVEQVEHVVQAIMPSTVQQQLLQIQDSEPCLAVHRRSWSNRKVASSAALIYPSSRYELRGVYSTNAQGRLERRSGA
jgi:GntR family histidine utilization transcriptional repressor